MTYEVVGHVQLQLQGFTGVTDKQEYEVVALTFKHRMRRRTLHAVVVDQLPNYKSPVGLNEVHEKLAEKRYKLADPKYEDKGGINLLIGADHYYDIVHSGYVREDGLILIPTIYGYVLSGQFQSPGAGVNVEVVTILKVATHPMEVQIGKINEEESLPEIKDLNALWELDHRNNA